MTFRNFRFFKIFRKIFFIEKIKVFGKFSLFIFLSYLMYYLSKYHRGTPTVPSVGAVNVPADNPKNTKIHIFEDFLGHFSLIIYIRFSLKYVDPKSSIQKFHRKFELFSKIFQFFIFCHVSSPISESFIAQLLLHPRARQKSLFFLQVLGKSI